MSADRRRWAALIRYFGQDDASLVACGHCDRCREAVPRSLIA